MSEEIRLSRVPIAVSHRLNRDFLESLNPVELVRHETTILDHMLFELRTYVWSKHIADQVVRYPATWWDAVKGRWAPQWWLRRWPVCWRVVEFSAHHDYPSMIIAGHKPELRIMRHESTQWGRDA